MLLGACQPRALQSLRWEPALLWGFHTKPGIPPNPLLRGITRSKWGLFQHLLPPALLG